MQQQNTKRERYETLRTELENERQSFLPIWRDIGDFILPKRYRNDVTDVNRGDRRSNKIYDSTATSAFRTLESGMMSGMTSPARPWFRTTLRDPVKARMLETKVYLAEVDEILSTAFLRSNLYNSLPTVYGDLGAFGTAAMLVEEDADTLIRTYTFPCGSYMLANNEKLRVEIFFRQFRLTVRQIVYRWAKATQNGSRDWSKVSNHIKNCWEAGNTEQWIDVCHVIMPNQDFDMKSYGVKKYKYTGTYYEKGASSSGTYDIPLAQEGDKVLEERGYNVFPVLAPRWRTSSEDVYGTSCPGFDCLPDVKQLQRGEKMTLTAIDKMVNPPMVAPASMKTQKTSMLPGDVTYVDERSDSKGMHQMHEVALRIDQLEAKQEAVRGRINRITFNDLFLMLANSDRREITAREIEERHEEKLWALGPVLEQVQESLLDPLIDIAFDIASRQKLLPIPPQEIAGENTKVEYISVMAQAQKLIGLSGIERTAQFALQYVGGTGDTSVLDVLDSDVMLRSVADVTGVPPSMMRSEATVQSIRQARAQAQQAAAAAEQMQGMAKASKDFARAEISGDNALGQILQQARAGQLAQTGP